MADGLPKLTAVDFDPFAPTSASPVRLSLTEPQAEMWTAAVMSREANCSYNQCFAFTFDGPLRVESLLAALDGVVARHAALRAVIAADGTSLQVLPECPVSVPVVDLSGLDLAGRESKIETLLDQECETPFDLERGPLIRATVVRESDRRHRFIFTVHHIVCDGWSSSVLFADLGLLYAADCTGIPAQLPPAASFQDYVVGQASADHVAAAKADEDYWAEQFADGAPVLDLPLLRPRPPTKTYRCGREHLTVDSELYADLKLVGAKAGATLFATLLAAFEVLVHRLSGQSEFVVGIPLAGQLELDNPALVAHCVNTVPLRAVVNPDAPFIEHVRTVSQGLSGAHSHPKATFGTLLRRLSIPRDPSRTPLVPLTFTTDRIGAPFDFGDVTIASVTTPKAYLNFELALNLVDGGSSIVVECEYNSDLFDAPTLRRWLSHYDLILRESVARPHGPVSALPAVWAEPTAGAANPDFAYVITAATPHVAPRTPTEARIATIWADAIDIESPGVDDNFFDVGGDSLKAAQIVTSLRSEFEVDVGMRHLFERPTIAGLAETVDLLAVMGTAAGGTAGDRQEFDIG